MNRRESPRGLALRQSGCARLYGVKPHRDGHKCTRHRTLAGAWPPGSGVAAAFEDERARVIKGSDPRSHDVAQDDGHPKVTFWTNGLGPLPDSVRHAVFTVLDAFRLPVLPGCDNPVE